MILGSLLGPHWGPTWSHGGPRRAPDATKVSKMSSQRRSQKKSPKRAPKSMDLVSSRTLEIMLYPLRRSNYHFLDVPQKSHQKHSIWDPISRCLGPRIRNYTLPGGPESPQAQLFCLPFFVPLPGDPKTREKTPQKDGIFEGPSPKMD